MATAAKPVTKKVTVYRNGDPSFRPVQYTYNERTTRTYAKLLEEIDRLAPPLRGGGVRTIYSVDGKTKIENLDDFKAAEGNGFVACGTEGYKDIKGGYENIGKKNKEPPKGQPADNKAKSDQQQAKDQQAKNDREKAAENRRKAEENRKKTEENRKKAEEQKKKKAEEERQKKAEETKAKSASKNELNEEKPSPRKEPSNVGERKVDVGDIKRFTVYRNGDLYFKPKQYIYKSKTMRNWDKFMEDMTKTAPPMKGGNAKKLFTTQGEEVANFDGLEEGQGYVVAGMEPFQQVKKGYENVGQPEGSPRKKPEDQKDGAKRNTNEKLMNRKDQTHPEPAFYFVFRNGHGLEAKRFIFTPKQIDKGMPWLLEQVGKKFDIYARKLVTMDNRDVHTVNDLVNKGAYVVIPLGEQFRDTWYYLPDLAKDTSENSNEDDKILDPGEEPDEDVRNGNRGGGGGGDKRRRRDSRDFNDQGRARSAQGGRRRRYSDDNYDEEYDSRTESGQENYSDEDRRRGGRNDHNHRPGSAASYCSYCDMLERHRVKHHYYSDDEDIQREPTMRSRRGSQRPRTNAGNDRSRRGSLQEERSPRNRSRSASPPRDDRRRGSTRPATQDRRGVNRNKDEDYDEDYEESPPRTPPRRSNNQTQNGTQLRRAKSDANMTRNRASSQQPNNKTKSAEQQQQQLKNGQKNQQQTNKKGPARSNSQSTINKREATNVSKGSTRK